MADLTQSGLDKQHAIVTGAGSGIGKAISLGLARCGMSVTLLGRDADRLRSVAALAPDGLCSICPTDLSQPASIEAFSTAWLARHHSLRVLVHCAGIYARSSLANTSAQQFDALFATNIRGPFLLTARMIPALRIAQGDVVFLNSSAALRPDACLAAYSSSKAALRALADSLRREVNRDRIRVLSVFAGRTATPMLQRLVTEEGGRYDPGDYLCPDDVAEAVINAVALAQSAELTEIHIRPVLPPGSV